MTFIEEFRQLEQAVAAFDSRYSFSDLSLLTDHDIYEIESSRLPLYSLKVNAYQERLRRCEIEEAKEQAKQEQLKARYGYRYPGKESLNAIDILRVEAYEAGLVHNLFVVYDEETAKKKIHEMIPAISEEEIEEYRRNAPVIFQV